MDDLIGGLFRFVVYVAFGFTLEIVFSVTGIERALGHKLEHKYPRKYLEGFVSLWMIPIHGFGMLFGFEFFSNLISEFHFIVRYLFYAVAITGTEALTGFIYDKIKGFYCWDYYKDSKYKVFERGYTLWTLIPLWGIAGMIMEVYSKLLVKLTPHVIEFFKGLSF